MTTDNSDDKTQILPEDDDSLDKTVVPEGDTDPLIGRRIGNYQVLSVLGRGGFGSVYKAEDTKLGRHVALKFLTQTGEGFHQELFEREAKALGILSKHPNIVQIHAWDEFEGKNFFVLEYMQSSVADLLEKYPEGMSVDLAIRIIAECSDALAFAHESEILHRDIKSPNILIEDEEGPAKIADFGLARICGVSNNTIEGAAIGSPAYMAPEQVRGQELTHLCDIYSLGVTLYELLCGQTPISGTSVLEILEKVRNNDRVPLQERKPSLPDELYAIVDKATAQEPGDRYGSAKEMAEALRGLDSQETPVPIAAAAPSKGNGAFFAAVAVLLFLIAGGIGYLYMMATQTEDDATTSTTTNTEPTIPDVVDEAISAEESGIVEKTESVEASVSPEVAPVEVLPAESRRLEDGAADSGAVAEETPVEEPAMTEAVVEEAEEVIDENGDGIVDIIADEGTKLLKSVIDSILDSGGGSSTQPGKSGGKGKGKGKGRGKNKK